VFVDIERIQRLHFNLIHVRLLRGLNRGGSEIGTTDDDAATVDSAVAQQTVAVRDWDRKEGTQLQIWTENYIGGGWNSVKVDLRY